MPEHILIVEDENHLGVGIKYNLGAEGFRVTLVDNGATALRLVQSDPSAYDLIILDLMLPGMSGYQVCETLRDGGIHLPVLMLSARTLAEDRTRGFDVGADQYMSKPFELDELISRVKNLLSRSSNSRPNPTPPVEDRSIIQDNRAQFGRVRVDFDSHQVIVAEDAVRMTAKELKLLRYFLDHPNRVIPRRELLVEVWDLAGNVQTRAVDNFIARLRKIIEPEPAEPVHLLTVRDAGYRFVVDPAS